MVDADAAFIDFFPAFFFSFLASLSLLRTSPSGTSVGLPIGVSGSGGDASGLLLRFTALGPADGLREEGDAGGGVGAAAATPRVRGRPRGFLPEPEEAGGGAGGGGSSGDAWRSDLAPSVCFAADNLLESDFLLEEEEAAAGLLGEGNSGGGLEEEEEAAAEDALGALAAEADRLEPGDGEGCKEDGRKVR